MNFFNFKIFKKEPNAPWSKYYEKKAMNLDIEDISLYSFFEEKVVLAQKLWDDYLVLDISNSFKKKYSSSG